MQGYRQKQKQEIDYVEVETAPLNKEPVSQIPETTQAHQDPEYPAILQIVGRAFVLTLSRRSILEQRRIDYHRLFVIRQHKAIDQRHYDKQQGK